MDRNEVTMSHKRLPQFLTPLAVVLAAAGALLVWHGPAQGQAGGSGSVTWSGRVRVEKHLTMNSHCTNCEHDVHDFTSTQHFTTEYQLEGIPQTASAEWSSNDVRIQLRGNMHSRSHGVNSKPDASTRESLIETQMEGSGHTVGGVSIFLRYAGEEDSGHCRIEFSAIGQREDGGALTQSIEMHGTEHNLFRYKESPTHDETKPASTTVVPDGDQMDVPCAAGAKALHGDRVTRDGGGQHVRVSWDLTQDGEAQTEVLLIPAKGYDQWLPQAGESESEIGDFIDVRIVAQQRGKPGSRPPQEVKKYKVELVDVSKEPGVCLNWPDRAKAKRDPDLKLDETNPYLRLLDKDGQAAETRQAGLTEFMVTVNSYDWGAHGKLQVTAEMHDGSTVVGHVENRASEFALALPKDENSNHVADWWEHWFELKNKAAEADEEKTPLGDGDDGDSIPLYEEYRGFRVQKKHERLSPEMKDVFVYDVHDLGLGYYAQTGLQVYRLSPTEVSWESGEGNNNTANGNRGTHTKGKVYAIKLLRYAIGEGAAGETEGGPGVPSRIQEVRIDTVRIAAAAGPYADAELKSTIAHELGHATNIWHHGDGLDYAIAGDVLCRRKNGTTKNFICASKDCFQAAVQHGAFSGDDKCIMRYDSTDFYEDAGGNCEWKVGPKTVHGRRYGYDAPGTIFCESTKGTGVNDTSKPPNKAGDAMAGRGECKYKFCVNSAKH